MILSTSAFNTTYSFLQTSLPTEFKGLMSIGFFIAALALVGYILLRSFPQLSQWLQSQIQSMINALGGQKREARLHKVVCYHCNKGMGLYNPIYSNIGGEPHIEGTCSLCGGFVRVRLH
jgi:hypothetical protein